MAGNVVPLLAEGTVGRSVAALAALLRPGGLLVAGFGALSGGLLYLAVRIARGRW